MNLLAGRRAAVIAAVLAGSVGEGRSSESERDKQHPAVRTSQPPAIDGHLDDPAWAQAPPDDRFTQNFPAEGRPPSERTTLQVLYDDDAIYLGVRLYDRRPEAMVERLTRRDNETDADRITIDLDSRNDRSSAYHFDVNISGVLADGVRYNDTEYSRDWDGLWTASTSRDGTGWTAEVRIPLRTIRYIGGTSAFGLQVRRFLQRSQEVDEWAAIPRTARGEVSYYGQLTGLEHLGSRRLIQVAPYAAVRLQARTRSPTGTETDLAGDLGADLKIGLTQALTLDAAVNPDFSQVEADQQVLNLTTFEVLFSERRPFFVEGSELFYTPIQLFYSRRIGAQAPAPALLPGESFSGTVPFARIYEALKVVGSLPGRWKIAFLQALTSAERVTVAGPLGPQERLLAPLSHFGVVRLGRDLFSNSSVGLTLTSVTRFEPANEAAPDPAGPCPGGGVPGGGRCTHDAYTGGIDFNLRTADGTWGGHGHLVGSLVSGGPTLTIADGTAITPGTEGWGFIGEVGKYGGERWLFKLDYQGLRPELYLRDAGYLPQANLHHLHPSATVRTRKPWGGLQEAQLKLELIVDQSWDGRAELLRRPQLSTTVMFQSFWTLSAIASYTLPRVDNRETRDGALTERVSYGFFELLGKTDPRARLVLSLDATAWQVQHGYGVDGACTLALRLVAPLEIDLVPHVNRVYGEPRWFDTIDNGDGSRTYWFGELEARSFDVALRATYTFTPRLTLQGYAQLFLAGGHFDRFTTVVGRGDRPRLALADFAASAPPPYSPDFRDGTINANVVLRWEYLPGSSFMGIYTLHAGQLAYDPGEGEGRPRLDPFRRGPASHELLLKLVRLWGG